jgi:S1-C subfamily serine protease
VDGVDPSDEEYPDAPVPQHERVWRHPSELGEAMWQRSEPPLAIGRGLLITSGAIGGLLALAVLWAMLPTNAGGGASAFSTDVVRTFREASSASTRAPTTAPASELSAGSERTTVTGRATAVTTRPATEVRSATTSAEPAAGTGSGASPGEGPSAVPSDDSTIATAVDSSNPSFTAASAFPGTSAVPSGSPSTVSSTSGSSTSGSSTGSTGSTISSSARPSNTSSSVASTLRPAGGSPGAPSIEVTEATISLSSSASTGPAIAVAVGSSPLVLTTAMAVGRTDDDVMLSYASGKTTHAKVTMIYNGIAVLSPDAVEAARTFAAAATPRAGDVVTLLSDSPTTASVTVAGDGSLQVGSWGGTDIAEGTPVVNAGGQLVGLCSHGSSGPKLVPVDVGSLRRMVSSMSEGSSSAPAWLGVQLNADPRGSLTINYVDPNGPAAAAGVVAGDTIVSIDASAMSSSRALYDILGTLGPDDQIALTVQHADGSQATVPVILAVAPASA